MNLRTTVRWLAPACLLLAIGACAVPDYDIELRNNTKDKLTDCTVKFGDCRSIGGAMAPIIFAINNDGTVTVARRPSP
jgi:hypothetical protein